MTNPGIPGEYGNFINPADGADSFRDAQSRADEPTSAELTVASDAKAVLHETLDNLGNFVCLDSQIVTDGAGRRRVRQEAAVTMNGTAYALRITKPAFDADTGDAPYIAMFPGFTEDPSNGPARNLHNAVSTLFPDSETVSVSSDGVSKHGSRIAPRDILNRDFDHLAGARLHILHQLADGREVVLNGLSMGSILVHRMVELNLDRSQPLIEHDRSVLHSPAIVQPDRIVRDMLLRFPFHITADIGKQWLKHPAMMAQAVYIPHFSATAYAQEMLQMRNGTPYAATDYVTGNSKVGLILPQNDPLAQIDRWSEMKRRHPDNVHMVVKPGEGHAMSINSREAARDIRSMTDYLGRLSVA